MSFHKNLKFRAFEERADACLEGSGSHWLFSGLSGVTANTWVVSKFSASKLLHFKAGAAGAAVATRKKENLDTPAFKKNLRDTCS